MKRFCVFKNLFFTFLFFALLMCTSISANAYSRVQQTGEKVIIVIDPGHGGENEGTIENGFLEKEMTLITAKAVYDQLSKYDNAEVYMTRTEDVDMSLKERAEYAASVNADFLFSIHYNASVDHDLFGSEVWISAEPPFNAYGYQFGAIQMDIMKEKYDLFIRGVKTKLNDRGTDYYGIIREATALNIPAVIIEHCHVDEDRDNIHCMTEEDWIDFGMADAEAIAKYFGLYSSSLGIDYTTYSENYVEAYRDSKISSTVWDDTEPDICTIDLEYIDYENGNVTLKVTACDYDSPLLYYDYSFDGGLTYSKLFPWPESDVMTGQYSDSFSFTFNVPSGTVPGFILRAYNMYDNFRESNPISMPGQIVYGSEEIEYDSASEAIDVYSDTVIEEQGKNIIDVDEYKKTDNKFLQFLKLCLLIVVLIFIIIFISQIISYSNRRKRRRRRK